MLTCLVIGVLIGFFSHSSVFAASDHGNISGNTVYASLSRGQTSTTGTTTSSMNAGHRVKITLKYYNAETPTVQTKIAESSDSRSVSLTVRGDGTSVATLTSSSFHGVYYQGYSWCANLSE